jgi:hypothetical protein
MARLLSAILVFWVATERTLSFARIHPSFEAAVYTWTADLSYAPAGSSNAEPRTEARSKECSARKPLGDGRVQTRTCRPIGSSGSIPAIADRWTVPRQVDCSLVYDNPCHLFGLTFVRNLTLKHAQSYITIA